jgi:hypothetical protein
VVNPTETSSSINFLLQLAWWWCRGSVCNDMEQKGTGGWWWWWSCRCGKTQKTRQEGRKAAAGSVNCNDVCGVLFSLSGNQQQHLLVAESQHGCCCGGDAFRATTARVCATSLVVWTAIPCTALLSIREQVWFFYTRKTNSEQVRNSKTEFRTKMDYIAGVVVVSRSGEASTDSRSCLAINRMLMAEIPLPHACNRKTNHPTVPFFVSIADFFFPISWFVFQVQNGQFTTAPDLGIHNRHSPSCDGALDCQSSRTKRVMRNIRSRIVTFR